MADKNAIRREQIREVADQIDAAFPECASTLYRIAREMRKEQDDATEVPSARWKTIIDHDGKETTVFLKYFPDDDEWGIEDGRAGDEITYTSYAEARDAFNGHAREGLRLEYGSHAMTVNELITHLRRQVHENPDVGDYAVTWTNEVRPCFEVRHEGRWVKLGEIRDRDKRPRLHAFFSTPTGKLVARDIRDIHTCGRDAAFRNGSMEEMARAGRTILNILYDCPELHDLTEDELVEQSKLVIGAGR